MTDWLRLLNLIDRSIVFRPPKRMIDWFLLGCLLHLKSINSLSAGIWFISLIVMFFISILDSFIYSVTFLPEGIKALHRMRLAYLVGLNVSQYLLDRLLLLSQLSFTYLLIFISHLLLIKLSLFDLELRVLALLASFGISAFYLMDIPLTADRRLTLAIIWSCSTTVRRNTLK